MRAPKTGTELRQQQIAEAAMELMNERGVSALCVSDIAARVGIVPSALYRHFRSKEEILDAVLEMIKSRLWANVEQAKLDAPDALGHLKALLVLHADLLSKNQAIPLLVFSDAVYLGDPARRPKVAEIIHGYLKHIADVVERGKRERSIREDVASSTAAVLFLGIILTGAALGNMSEGEFDVVSHARKVWPAFTRALIPDNQP